MALDFIRTHRDDEAPYFLEVAPYAPHSRTSPTPAYPGDPLFPPAFGDRPGRTAAGTATAGWSAATARPRPTCPGTATTCADNAPRTAPTAPIPRPQWRPDVTLSADRGPARDLRDRARMVQSIDRTVERILDEVGPDTYVVLTSDNGFHLGQHGLGRGKGTPYDSDVHVPLLVTGPGVVPGPRTEVVSNIDLASTFEDLAGLDSPATGPAPRSRRRSRTRPLDRRGYTFFEHTWAPSLGFDPDRPYSGGTLDVIPSYTAVRSKDGLLVRLDLDPDWAATDIAWEFYSYAEAPYERTNRVRRPGVRRPGGRAAPAAGAVPLVPGHHAGPAGHGPAAGRSPAPELVEPLALVGVTGSAERERPARGPQLPAVRPAGRPAQPTPGTIRMSRTLHRRAR